MDIEYAMSNTELNDAITTTHQMILDSRPSALRKEIKEHLDRLLELQMKRASLAHIPEKIK
jgi:hypothetical protein